MKLKLCSGSKKRLLSRALAFNLLLSSIPFGVFAGTLSDDGRYETFEGDSITIDNVLEEDEVDVEIEGNTLVNVSSTKDETPVTPSKVDTSGNHVLLDGDGHINPLIEGNTLVNLFRESDNVVGDRWGWINFSSELLNPNITYTIIVNNLPDLKNIRWCLTSYDNNINDDKFLTQYTNSNMATFSSDSYAERLVLHINNNQVDEIMQEQLDSVKVIILEGDYTDKELPEYFTGLKSSFEDNLITQEMMNSGQEKAENLGKYKIEVKSTGKNKWSFGDRVGDVVVLRSGDKPILKKGTYTVTSKSIPEYDYPQALRFENKNRNILVSIQLHTTYTFTLQDDVYGFVLYSNGYEYSSSIGKVTTFKDIQIEEGSVATEYEPYKESIQTLYLNSPLLYGDTIEEIDGEIYHVKRCDKVTFEGKENWWLDSIVGDYYVFANKDLLPIAKENSMLICDKFTKNTSDGEKINHIKTTYIRIHSGKLNSLDAQGFKQWLSQNPVTVVYELAEPIYETISEESILIDSYKDGHLDFNTNIPLSSVEFLPFEEELKYLYKNKKYSIQFKSSAKSTANIYLGGTELLNQNIVKGSNKFEITTPSTLIDNKLILNGVGFNISEVVVTEHIENNFEYFEGISSVGQDNENGHKIEIASTKNLITEYNLLEVEGRTEINFGTTPILQDVYIHNLSNKTLVVHTSRNYQYYRAIHVQPNMSTFLDIDNESIYAVTTEARYGWSKISKADVPNIFAFTLNENEINKKEIKLSEPLRSLPNGVKDRIIKKNGQWLIERNTKEIIINTSNAKMYFEQIWDDYYGVYLDVNKSLGMFFNHISGARYYYSDFIIYPSIWTVKANYYSNEQNMYGLSSTPNEYIQFFFKLPKEDVDAYTGIDNERVQKWFEDNCKELQMVYQLETPEYEPLNIDLSTRLFKETTYISTNSAVKPNLKVTVDRAINKAYEALELVKENPSAINISQSRYWTNLLKESIKKDELQSEINDILNIEDFKIEPKSITSSADIYIIPKNNLTMSLNTNSITFDEFDSTNDLEMLNAVEITINSSLPYELNATLPVGISNSNKDTSLPVNILNIKESNDLTYKTFSNIDEKLTITDESLAGINTHKIDLKLSGGLTNKADVYKTTLKFEAKQK